MKTRKISDAEMARREQIRSVRAKHYAGEPQTPERCVGKGPRGKWYVKQGKELVSGPYETEDEARAA